MTSGDVTHEEPGHHWKDADRVRDFAERMDRRVDDRLEQFHLISRIIGAPKDAELKILDVGAGYGSLTSALLDWYPSAKATLLDVSEAMVELGRERMQPYDGWYAYIVGDFASGSLPDEVGDSHDAIVSSLAIHHLPADGKRSLYGDIFARLAPGGWFLNLDIVAPNNAVAGETYRRIFEEDRVARDEKPWPSTGDSSSHHSEMQRIAEHLTWLEEAGFTAVDCYWKRFGTAIFGGRKP